MFGYRPEVFSDAMAGKRVDVVPNIGTYKRSIVGERLGSHSVLLRYASSHLFQQRGKSVQRARFGSFARNATRGGEECKKRSDESFRGNQRALTYGNSYLSKPITLKTLAKMDAEKACRCFNDVSSTTSHFTMVLVGAFDIGTILPLLEKYRFHPTPARFERETRARQTGAV